MSYHFRHYEQSKGGFVSTEARPRERDGSADLHTLETRTARANQSGKRAEGRKQASTRRSQPDKSRLPERFFRTDLSRINDHDLAEFLLVVSGECNDTSAEAHAAYLISKFGSFANLVSASAYDLRMCGKLNEVTIAFAMIVKASVSNLIRSELQVRSVITNMAALADYLRVAQSREGVDCFRVLYLDKRFRLIGEKLFTGSVGDVLVYPRTILQAAFDLRASGLITSRNKVGDTAKIHPDDEKMIVEILSVSQLYGLVYQDHILLNNEEVTSVRATGRFWTSDHPPIFTNNLAECTRGPIMKGFLQD